MTQSPFQSFHRRSRFSSASWSFPVAVLSITFLALLLWPFGKERNSSTEGELVIQVRAEALTADEQVALARKKPLEVGWVDE